MKFYKRSTWLGQVVHTFSSPFSPPYPGWTCDSNSTGMVELPHRYSSTTQQENNISTLKQTKTQRKQASKQVNWTQFMELFTN